MRIKVFTVSICDPEEHEKEVNVFLNGHRILEVVHEFVPDGLNSRWCFLVKYLEGPGKNRGPAFSQERIDYKNVLGEAAFVRFCSLRKARKIVAEAEGVPAFAVFSDRQMADLAGLGTLSLADMGKVRGIGPAKTEKYGPAILKLLQEDISGEKDGDENETGRESV